MPEGTKDVLCARYF